MEGPAGSAVGYGIEGVAGMSESADVSIRTVAAIVGTGVGLSLFGFWLWALADVVTNKLLDSSERLMWAVVLVFTLAAGAFLYLAKRGQFASRRAAA